MHARKEQAHTHMPKITKRPTPCCFDIPVQCAIVQASKQTRFLLLLTYAGPNETRPRLHLSKLVAKHAAYGIPT